MFTRRISEELIEQLDFFPVVGLLGPRQSGKTTLAKTLLSGYEKATVYLDLENPIDLLRLSDPLAFFNANTDKLIVLDEIQRMPEVFPILRGVVDENRRQGISHAQFLILGSASVELLRQSSESLAGRVAYIELAPLSSDELPISDRQKLWTRGGFPNSILAKTDRQSFIWRSNFITTYLERDIPQYGLSVSAVSLRRLWTMLCHMQGDLVNYSTLARSLDVTSPTLKKYLDYMEELFLIRRLMPWHGNLKKRLVKQPKVYVRDSGICHTLLNISTLDQLMSHPHVGASWEGWVIENLLVHKPVHVFETFYRSSVGAEIDLVLEFAGKIIAIEIKKSLAPRVTKGFHYGAKDINATHKYVVYPGELTFMIKGDVQVTPLDQMQRIIASW